MQTGAPRRLPVLQQLCLDCGACCDGTLFECLELEPHEQALLPPGLAVTLELEETGAPTGFMFPCPMHSSSGCHIYDARPSRCARFVCKVYEAHQTGELTLEQAQERVAQLKRLASHIAGLLGWGEHEFSTQRFRNWAANHPGGEARARREHPEAFMKYGVLRVFMERHFLHSKSR